MNVTKDVIKDLLPLYQAGEVSQDTRRLVDDYLGSDPELRQLVASALDTGISGIGREKMNVRHEIDQALATLEKTKRVMARQKWTQIYAILFTLMPFSFAFQDGQVKYLLVRDAPWSLIPLWGAAAVFWVLYARTRRLRSGAV